MGFFRVCCCKWRFDLEIEFNWVMDFGFGVGVWFVGVGLCVCFDGWELLLEGFGRWKGCFVASWSFLVDCIYIMQS